MIKRVSVTNPKGEVLDMELGNPEKSGFAIINIEGLGPPQADINGQELATADGMLYSSARAQTRNILLHLLMWPRDSRSKYGRLSTEECRHLTYRYFPLKKRVRITIETDARTSFCEGYVESNEPEIFSNQEMTTISIICPDPYFYVNGDSQTIFSGIRPNFEFPFSNESLTEPMLEFGQIWIDRHAIIEYRGSVDTGVLITIHSLSGPAEGIKLYNVDTQEQMIIDTSKIAKISGEAFGEKDDIVISTVKKDRYCKLLRKGVYTNIIGALSMDSDWFQISSGANGFAFTADKGADNLSVTFGYKDAYVGV